MVPQISEPPTTRLPPIIHVEDPRPKSPPPPSNHSPRPHAPRRATAPEPPIFPSPFSNMSTQTLALRTRTRSPFARGHMRSHSSSSSVRAPQMTRAHSSPVPDTTARLLSPRPSSPLNGSIRHCSPMRRSSDETYPGLSNTLDTPQTISENSELNLTPRATSSSSYYDSTLFSPFISTSHTFPRTRRRLSSPLSQMTQPAFPTTPIITNTPSSPLRSYSSTPSLAIKSQYNESYPTLTTYPSNSSYSYSLSSASSVPSTPTSLRSRSPSISSLETIPDSPDAELEAENIAALKKAAEREEEEQSGRRRVGSLGSVARDTARDKRKRWSVCGAERRGDLDLETIWED